MTISIQTTLWLGDFAVADHEGVGVARLLWQYRGRPRMEGMLASFLADVQSLEDVSLETWAGVWPLTAVGVQLDVLGRLVGQARGQMVDAEYRLFILGRILANRSNGTWPDLFELLAVLGVDSDVFAVENWPCEITISVVGTTYGESIGRLVADAKSGGVTINWTWSDETESDTFALAAALGVEQAVDATRGFGDLAGGQASGGYLSGGFVS